MGKYLYFYPKKGGLISLFSGESFTELFSTQSSVFSLYKENASPVNSALRSLNTIPRVQRRKPIEIFHEPNHKIPLPPKKQQHKKKNVLPTNQNLKKLYIHKENQRKPILCATKHNPPSQISDLNDENP